MPDILLPIPQAKIADLRMLMVKFSKMSLLTALPLYNSYLKTKNAPKNVVEEAGRCIDSVIKTISEPGPHALALRRFAELMKKDFDQSDDFYRFLKNYESDEFPNYYRDGIILKIIQLMYTSSDPVVDWPTLKAYLELLSRCPGHQSRYTHLAAKAGQPADGADTGLSVEDAITLVSLISDVVMWCAQPSPAVLLEGDEVNEQVLDLCKTLHCSPTSNLHRLFCAPTVPPYCVGTIVECVILATGRTGYAVEELTTPDSWANTLVATITADVTTAPLAGRNVSFLETPDFGDLPSKAPAVEGQSEAESLEIFSKNVEHLRRRYTRVRTWLDPDTSGMEQDSPEAWILKRVLNALQQ